jgi:hypothetical protein
MKAWSAFYPDVLPDLPGAPLPMVDHWLRNAAIELCERSKALVADLDLIDAVANQPGYELLMPTGSDLVEITSAWFSGKKITPKSPLYLDSHYEDWTAQVGTPEHYTQQGMDSVLLVPMPSADSAGAIKIKAAIKPSATATGVDDWLYAQFRKALAAGCKAGMMAMPGVAWANPDRVTLNAGLFEAAVSDAMASASNGFTRAKPRFSGGFC